MNKKHKNIFQDDIEVPDIVRLKAEEAFLQIKEKGTVTMKDNNIAPMQRKTKKLHKILKPAIAACACAALFLTAGKFHTLHHISENNAEENYVLTTESDNLPQTLSNMFSLKVYAADSPDASDSGYVTLETGKSILVKETGLESVLCEGEDGFISYCIGTKFLCEGDNIESITYSISEGAFQIVKRPNDTILTSYEEYDGSLSTGLVGDKDSDTLDNPVSVYGLYKSFTVSYDNQSNDHTWINICNETDRSWDFLYGKDMTLEDRVDAIEEMMQNVVITCTVHYTDGTSEDAFITIGGGIYSNKTGIPEKDTPHADFEFRLAS